MTSDLAQIHDASVTAALMAVGGGAFRPDDIERRDVAPMTNGPQWTIHNLTTDRRLNVGLELVTGLYRVWCGQSSTSFISPARLDEAIRDHAAAWRDRCRCPEVRGRCEECSS